MKTHGYNGLWQAVIMVALTLGGAARAESPALLLEQGIYAEQTEGDLDKAIGLYQQIIDEAQQQRSIVGHAHLRIGLCLLKSGRNDAGAKQLQTVLDAYADDPALTAQVKAAAKAYDLALIPAGSPLASWQKRLEECTDHKQAAFSVGPMMLDSLSPDEAWEVVKAAWPNLKNDDVKTGICKAFAFRNHPRVLDVLDLGMADFPTGVRMYVKDYVAWYAFQDFAEDYSAYPAWRKQYAGMPLEEVVAENLRRLAEEIAALPPEEVSKRAEILYNGKQLDQYPHIQEVLQETGLMQAALNWLASDTDNLQLRRAAVSVLRAAKPSQSVLEQRVLPIVTGARSAEARNAALQVLGSAENTWALPALLDAMVAGLKDTTRGRDWTDLSRALADIGDLSAIPTMIGVLAAHDDGETRYAIGYYGLRTLTGVKFDDSHDGAWWINWWERNKSFFSTRMAWVEVPTFTSAAGAPAKGEWSLGAANRSAYAMARDEANIFRDEVPTTLYSTKPEPPGFATLLQSTHVAPYRGQRCWLNAQVKCENVAGWSGLWMRVDDAAGKTLSFDNMEDRPIQGTGDWQEYHVVLDVPASADSITYGLLLHGAGQVWLADVEMQPAPNDLPVTSKPDPAPGAFFLVGMDPKSYEMGEETAAPHPDLETRYLKSVATPKGFGTMMANLPAADYRGKRCKLTAQVKAENVADWAGLWMRVDGPDNKPLAFDNMQDRPIKGSHDWKNISVVLDVPEDAENIAYGVLMDGEGQVWTAGLKLEEAAPDTPLTGKALE